MSLVILTAKNRVSIYVWLGKLDTVLLHVWYWAGLPRSENVVFVDVWCGQVCPSETSFDDRDELASVVR